MTQLAQGQVWVYAPWENTNLEVQYQILALWDDWAWVYVHGARSKYQKDPQSYCRDFFESDNMRLKYDVPLSIP